MIKNLILFLVVIAIVTACTKSNDVSKVNPSVTVDSLLEKRTWQMAHIAFLQNGTLYYYNRGAANNSFNFDADNLTFKKDSTGTYSNANGSYAITWNFTNIKKDKIAYIIFNYDNGAPKPGSNLKINLENVNVTDSTLKYAEIYNNSAGVSTISSVERTPH